MKGWKEVPEECCGTCEHFHQHYVRSDRGRYSPLWCGHCTHPRVKNRLVEEHCPHWTAKETQND